MEDRAGAHPGNGAGQGIPQKTHTGALSATRGPSPSRPGGEGTANPSAAAERLSGPRTAVLPRSIPAAAVPLRRRDRRRCPASRSSTLFPRARDAILPVARGSLRNRLQHVAVPPYLLEPALNLGGDWSHYVGRLLPRANY